MHEARPCDDLKNAAHAECQCVAALRKALVNVAAGSAPGPSGVELFEVMMGDPRSFPADLEGYERFLAARNVEQLPNPPIDMPGWLEDTRS